MGKLKSNKMATFANHSKLECLKQKGISVLKKVQHKFTSANKPEEMHI